MGGAGREGEEERGWQAGVNKKRVKYQSQTRVEGREDM